MIWIPGYPYYPYPDHTRSEYPGIIALIQILFTRFVCFSNRKSSWLFTRAAAKLQCRSRPYFGFSNLQAIASFIDLSRIVASARRAGRSANECSDRKNSEIYSLVYNDHFIDGRIIQHTCHSVCCLRTTTTVRFYNSTVSISRIISINKNLCTCIELCYNKGAILLSCIYVLLHP